MKRKKATQKTPMKQTKISSFFSKGESSRKRLCTNNEIGSKNLGSPEVILCSPPKKNSGTVKKSILGSLNLERPEVILSSPPEKSSGTVKRSILGSLNVESPEVILCTPPKKSSGNVKRSILGSLNVSNKAEEPGNVFKTCGDSPKGKIVGHFGKSPKICSDDIDSAYFENCSPLEEELKLKGKQLLSPKKPLQISNDDNVFSNFDDFVDDFDDGWFTQRQSQNVIDLDFDPCILCQVVSTEVRSEGIKHEQIIVVRSKAGSSFGRCILRDMWALNIEFSVGDSLSVYAYHDGKDWIVDAKKGYVCLYPELLVSSTSLVGAMFCRRRAVLSNYFKGLDSDNKIMLIGKLVHEILQMSLSKPTCSSEDLEKIINEIIIDPPNLRSLYSSDLPIVDAVTELKNYIPFIINFLMTYVKAETKPTGKNFKGMISDIIDIEEDVSCMKLGIKGRIDVTVHVKIDGLVKKMPLELKTGRASFSTEHKNQVFLYTMMMSDLGEKVESGLLLYIKEGIMEEIKPSATEIRDLILLRNDFAQYLRRFDANALPNPIQFTKACQKCPYATICSAFLDENVPQNDHIRSIKISLRSDHLAYFQKWTQLLILEDSYESVEDNAVLSGLILEDGVVRLKNEFKYSFSKGNAVTNLKAGNFVVVTSENKIYTGRIVEIAPKHCSIAFPKEISSKEGLFEVKGYKGSMLTKYLTNLGEFMEESHTELRNIVINNEPAKVRDKLPKHFLKMDCLKILGELNEDQQRAILKVLAAENYLLIEGPPGTGKTQTIAALVRIFVQLNNSVLLVGHTHSSVDNVLLRLTDLDFLRLGNCSSINQSLHSKSYSILSQGAKTVEDIASLLSKPVIGSTCLGLDADIVTKRKFDVCIMDESSQVLQPEAFKPLFAAKKFVLIGDPKQLRPVVRNPMAKRLGMDESIFERLLHESSLVSLTIQYRMNEPIMTLANSLIYSNKLKAGSELVQNKVLSLNTLNIAEKWIKDVLSTDLCKSVVFVNTSNYLTLNEKQSFSCSNSLEVNITVKLIKSFLECGAVEENIGVMAPYREQILKLSEVLPKCVEVNTVDQYQGRDKDIILFSCTRMDRLGLKGENEILNDIRRFTVSVTRAKCKLIIIGDKDTLIKYKTFERLFMFLSDVNYVTLVEGEHDFSWSSFL